MVYFDSSRFAADGARPCYEGEPGALNGRVGLVLQKLWRSDVVLQDLINEVDYQYEEGYSRQPPEGAPEKYGCQNGQQYQDQILLPAHAGAGQAEIAPMHARASTPVVLIVFLEP